MADNSLDRYSKPIRQEDTRLSTVFWLNPRDSKKGRLFIPLFDERYPLKFRARFVYVSKFLEKDNAAGNHYHKKKEEVLVPLQGKFDFFLEDINTKEKEVFSLGSDDNKAVYIRTGVSHKIVSKDKTGILIVLASSPSSTDDEIEYDL